MYSVTKRLDFCYGHRLLNYDGVCRYLHGHNAMVEIDITAAELDDRNMVVDFTDVKNVVKAWIDRELDHKMILCHDDPMVEVLRAQGEPVFTLDSNPTAERLARLIYDTVRELGFSVSAVRLWETPGSCASWRP
ncbi:MAG: 6-carboxytetrahydropterin synthase [Acidobacteria bacterium]|jgi:6-pyruvoyltetrahydropterin/6-carboxytetrahydropterin synthase|nr:6-carboxytetrahydropterin synthase [Acidobacteriota bacterium]